MVRLVVKSCTCFEFISHSMSNNFTSTKHVLRIEMS